jgi:hypothetical protein
MNRASGNVSLALNGKSFSKDVQTARHHLSKDSEYQGSVAYLHLFDEGVGYATSIHQITEKRSSRQPSFQHLPFSETGS